MSPLGQIETLEFLSSLCRNLVSGTDIYKSLGPLGPFLNLDFLRNKTQLLEG